MARFALHLLGRGQRSHAVHPQLSNVVGILATIVLNAPGCTFDVTPGAMAERPHERNNATIFWSPPAARRSQAVGSAQRSDAGADSAPMAVDARDSGTRDAGMQARANAGSESSSGAAGTTAAAGGASAAGSPAVASEPDAGTNALCAAGRYDGTFDGSVTFLQGSLTGIQGTIRATMALDPSGEYLRVREGNVTGVNDQGVKMNAGWTGALNCKTGQLEDAVLVDGTWDNGSRFSGTLAGSYVIAASTLSGTWQVRSDELVWAGGNGTWNMRRSAIQ